MSDIIPITLKAKDKKELVEKLRLGAALGDVRYTLDRDHARLMAECIEYVLDIEEMALKARAELKKQADEIRPKILVNMAILIGQIVLTVVLWASLIWGPT